MKAVIFAGGVGTRLWPLSRKNAPKQFMGIVGDKTMLQLCIDRLTPGFDIEDIYITTGAQFAGAVKEQLPKIKDGNIISEPATRDVGPAVGLVAALLAKNSPHEPVALLWGSDHLVKKEGYFRRVLKSAGELIEKDPNQIILVGQQPRFASQNLGWISFGSKVKEDNEVEFYQLNGFKYRPDPETADKFYKDGKHAWNLGYWVTSAGFLWSLFEQFAPEIYEKLLKIQDAYGTDQYQHVLEEIYPTIEKISFDNAIVEKMDFSKGLVVSADLGWSDVGAWEALKEALEENKEANVTRGRVIVEDSVDSLVYNYEDNKLVVGIDLDDLLVVNTNDVLLVTKKESVPKIKKFVESLAGTEHEDLT
jgi:mannose-1-phosphate guanylyltransferase